MDQTEEKRELFFFDYKEVCSSLLICPLCNQLFQRPILLPCSHSVCQNCLQSLKIEHYDQCDLIECPKCHKTHEKKVDYEINEMLSLLLKMEQKKLNRGLDFEELIKKT
jgi:hypothetical protein